VGDYLLRLLRPARMGLTTRQYPPTVLDCNVQFNPCGCPTSRF
jgi:hypothetical protein